MDFAGVGVGGGGGRCPHSQSIGRILQTRAEEVARCPSILYGRTSRDWRTLVVGLFTVGRRLMQFAGARIKLLMGWSTLLLF